MTETNPDALQNICITLFKNNQTIILQEGTDYRIEVRGGNGQWYEYIYTVLAKNFADDGVYRLTFYSEDAAGNIAENTLDTALPNLTRALRAVLSPRTKGVSRAIRPLPMMACRL